MFRASFRDPRHQGAPGWSLCRCFLTAPFRLSSGTRVQQERHQPLEGTFMQGLVYVIVRGREGSYPFMPPIHTEPEREARHV